MDPDDERPTVGRVKLKSDIRLVTLVLQLIQCNLQDIQIPPIPPFFLSLEIYLR